MNVQAFRTSVAKHQGEISKATAAARRICREDADFNEVRALVAALPFVSFSETEQVARAVYAEVQS